MYSKSIWISDISNGAAGRGRGWGEQQKAPPLMPHRPNRGAKNALRRNGHSNLAGSFKLEPPAEFLVGRVRSALAVPENLLIRIIFLRSRVHQIFCREAR